MGGWAWAAGRGSPQAPAALAALAQGEVLHAARRLLLARSPEVTVRVACQLRLAQFNHVRNRHLVSGSEVGGVLGERAQHVDRVARLADLILNPALSSTQRERRSPCSGGPPADSIGAAAEPSPSSCA